MRWVEQGRVQDRTSARCVAWMPISFVHPDAVPCGPKSGPWWPFVAPFPGAGSQKKSAYALPVARVPARRGKACESLMEYDRKLPGCVSEATEALPKW